MASTSTQLQDRASLPSGSSYWKYDVFLNFRGEDTRYGFVDHLYSALHENVIFPFKDDQRLKRGEFISPALFKAIEESRFAVVVFSENYASSKWCLEELVYILECQTTRGLTVLPVFYKVNPSDLRKQRGSIGEAFAKHERDSNEEKEKEKVQRWRNALVETANISGWDLETNRAEAKLVKDIAIDILKRLGYNDSSPLDDVVGLFSRIEKVMSLLEMELDLDDPRVVGIFGMGGIGKTTIAKAIYHQIRSRFHASCYLENVREYVRKHGMESLQKYLLADIHLVLDNDIKNKNIDWLWRIRNAVRNKRVLVVLDDVDHPDQLDALVGKLDWFGQRSRIIITTRNSQLLAKYGPRSHVYEVVGLNNEEAFKLFCCKAFWNNQPTPDFQHLIKSAIDYAHGVPLALKVLGCYLIGREVNEWQSAINRLRQQPNPDIQNVLKLSYDGLGYYEKKIFLDIACFFKECSMDYNTIKTILDACGFYVDIGINVLEEKALIVKRGNMIDMHNLIQEMGWHIVNEESLEEPGGRSRLWRYEDIYHTLTKKKGTKAVETIVMNHHERREMSLSHDAFLEMSKLRLLKLSNVQLPDGLDYLSNDLRFLYWQTYPLKYLPSNFQPNNLVKLIMADSRLKQSWDKRMCLNKLKYVNFSCSPCIVKIRDFTQVANLKELILVYCTNLVEIDPSIEAVIGLTLLNLRGCKYLKILPTGCWLKSLEDLDLSLCSKLKNVSEVLASTKCLIRLDLGGTCVKELPVEHLSNLESIELRNCKELTSLPSGICGLKHLFSLDVLGCSKLSKLPECLGELENLKFLYAGHTAIRRLPSSIVQLKKLELPSSIVQLKKLEFLFLSWIVYPKKLMPLSRGRCKGGVSSTPWKSLVSSFLIPKEREDPVVLDPCPLLGLLSLSRLALKGCILLDGLLPNDLGSLSSLQYLLLESSNIISLPTSFRDLYKIVNLDVSNCKELKSLLYLPKNIISINANGCTSLETFPDPLPRELVGVSLGNCHPLAKNRPSLPLELFTNYLKDGFARYLECTIIIPGREIPKCFNYQNNMGHYVGIKLMPDWHQRLRGFVICAVFEGKAPSIDSEVYVECYGMRNDVVVFDTVILIYDFQFQSDHLFLDYIRLGEIGRKAGVNDHLKTCTEIIFYFGSCSLSSYPRNEFVPAKCKCDGFAPAKCAVHMVYQNDKEWPDPHASIQQSDCDEFGSTAQWMDSQSELSETSIQKVRDSIVKLDVIHHVGIKDRHVCVNTAVSC